MDNDLKIIYGVLIFVITILVLAPAFLSALEFTGNGEFSPLIGTADVGGITQIVANLTALSDGVITETRMGSATAGLCNTTTYIIQDGVILASKEALNWQYDNSPTVTFDLTDYSDMIYSSVDSGKFIVKTNVSAGKADCLARNSTYPDFSGTLFNYSTQGMMGGHPNAGYYILYTFNETTAPPVDTCTCAGAGNDWEIDMSDYCNITEACDLTTGTLNFTGAGWCNCNASVDTTNLGDPGASGVLYIQDSCLITID